MHCKITNLATLSLVVVSLCLLFEARCKFGEQPVSISQSKSIGNVDMSRLGIEVADTKGKGVVVKQVERGSPAALTRPSSLQENDVVLTFDGTKIENKALFLKIIESSPSSVPLKMEIRNRSEPKGDPLTFTIILRPSGELVGACLVMKGAELVQCRDGEVAKNCPLQEYAESEMTQRHYPSQTCAVLGFNKK